MSPVPLPKACVFDLDGTLVDSLRDIAESLNECLELLGLASQPIDRYRFMVGEGIPKLCMRAIGDSQPHLTKRLTELARARYRVRPMQHTKPFDGISELIGRLRAGGVKLAVLSNKPHDMTVRMVNAFWPDGQFQRVYGYREERLRKPDPHYLLRICSELGVEPRDTWMVGDTPTDMQTARNAGVASIGVTWGFRTRAELQANGASRIIDHPSELV